MYLRTLFQCKRSIVNRHLTSANKKSNSQRYGVPQNNDITLISLQVIVSYSAALQASLNAQQQNYQWSIDRMYS